MENEVETPKERAARYIKMAELAEESAKNTKDIETKNGFKALALSWRSLAGEAAKRG